ncbi:AraC family transcriptional regulator [Pedobacter yulinensis]|uniref:AraC family transcriptional regulator n=1 Tax=Pedobacter yulinensis TaxID=2126353 RepID=A0A2T3HIS2_9SPHI|nr:AraC family transcriptional regulator [Pedobacter yulinensis]PST82345.1 AraC family transcriptional regulator [Pedobacter yulinensis]
MKVQIPNYDISYFDEYHQEGLLVSRFGSYARKHQHLHKAHRHSFYHLVFFLQAAGSHTIDFVNYPLQDGVMYFMAPGQVHSWSFDGEPEGYIVNFPADYYSRFLQNTAYLEQFGVFDADSGKQVIQVDQPMQQKLSSLFEEMLAESKEPGAFHADLVRILLMEVCIWASRLSGIVSESNPSYGQRLLKNFRALIDRHFREQKFPHQYASQLYITPNHLNALCNELTGKSAGTLIRERCLLEAKRMLVNADTSISAIAEALAFTDQSYFGRFFKRHEGISPEKFRKKLQQQTHG